MSELRERLLYPRAGWLSLGLLAVMALALAWSVQGAAWLEQLDYLAPVALWAVLFGALIGLLPVTIVVLLPLGAIIGAAVVIWAVGGEYHTALDQGGRLLALRADLLGWTKTVVETGYPIEMSPYAIGLGALIWATAFTASYVVYRYHRVLDAILLLGAAIITNMSATFTDLFGDLLLFVIAALLLWLRASLINRQDGWQRRRVNENLEVPAAIMRSGILFAGASVALAWILTSVAVAAPLTGAWRSLDGVWSGVRDQFEGAFGSLTNPQSRITGSSFGPSFTVAGDWVSNDEEVLVLAASEAMYLRTATYDHYTGRGWGRTDGPTRQVAAGDPLFTGATTEWPSVTDAVELERVTIQMRQTVGRNIFAPGAPLKIFAPTVVREPAGLPFLGSLEAANPIADGEAYEAWVAISNATQAQLANAPSVYPAEVTELYLDTTGITDRVRQLAEAITAEAESPYEKAELLARYLSRDETFTYETSPPTRPADADLVDYFLFDAENGRIGYCEHYASAMVLMARAVGLPARMAVGFAPGERQDDDTFLVREANRHAWAEVYFPGYGWQIFEATKSIPSVVRASGAGGTVVPPPRVDDNLIEQFEQQFANRGDTGVNSLPSPDLVEGAVDPDRPGAASDDDGSRTGNAIVILLLGIGAAAVIWLRMRQVQRRWRLLPAGDRAWNQLTAAAGRAGVGPRPSETIYEYAGWLEDQLPRHSEPIRTVADGKVWQAYSGRRMTVTASNGLDAAWARLRVPLLGLAVRRWLRRVTRRGD